MDNRISTLKELVDSVLGGESVSLEDKITALGDQFKDGSSFSDLSDSVIKLCREFSALKNRTVSELDKLTDEEREELKLVEDIIDNNRLTYHFQPIVSAADGSIYSYEALMRPVDAPRISPYHILKYAAITNRLRDVERETFLNVLTIIDKDQGKFSGRRVFINSIPNIRLNDDDRKSVLRLLSKHCDTAVIEMTEQAELDEEKIRQVKDLYDNINVRIAIDDYGTGYSNVKNLLDYMPNYVKIDRSLLSNIQNSSKKRHFVRDIIDFCHDNGIQALAEGVETAEELRTVILMGVDLIQGYYTAKPSAVILDKISDEVKAEILRFRDEMRDGIASRQYTPKPDENVQLDALARDGVSAVIIGKDFKPGDSVTISGSLSSDTPISVICLPEFNGTLIIDQIRLLSIRNRPCISLTEGCNAKICISGENRLLGGGIQVPFHSSLEVVGHGSLYIKLDQSEYFGIGNDLTSKHGNIRFAHNSMLTIDANGQRGVAIGSGSGGSVEIVSGKYLIKQQGSYGVGIGSFLKDTDVKIVNCDLQIKISASKCTGIGSLYSNASVEIQRSSFRCFLAGLTAAALGSSDGNNAVVKVDSCNISIDVRADDLTAAGSLQGSSDVRIQKTSFNVTAAGLKAVAFGGLSDDTRFSSNNADVSVDLFTNFDSYTLARPENVFIEGGRCVFTVNNHNTDN